MKIHNRILILWTTLSSKQKKELSSYPIIRGKTLGQIIELLKSIKPQQEVNVPHIKTLYRIETLIINNLIDFKHIESGKYRLQSFELAKRYAQLRFFEDMSQHTLFSYYANRLLKQTQKEGNDDLSLLISERLVYHYSFTNIDMSKANKYELIYKNAITRIDLKKELSKSYYWLVQNIVLQKAEVSDHRLGSIKRHLDQQKELLETPINDIIASRILSSLYFYHLLNKDSAQMVSVSLKALDYFRKNFPNKPMQQYMFTLRLGVAYIYTEEYNEARQNIEKCIALNPTVGTLHWNSTYSYYFTLEMLTKNYQAAADILVKIATTKEINKLDDMWLQQWRIRSAYIHFLAKIDYVDLMVLGRRRVPNFKLGKFLNDVPLYAKDKRGLNISILIAQVLILLADKKWDKIYDRMESLSQYSYRHFKNDSAVRSNCFIRMLLSLAKADFNPKRAQRYAQKYVDRLSTTEMNLNEYSTEIEIIPYEDLWQIILGLTEGKKHIRKRPK